MNSTWYAVTSMAYSDPLDHPQGLPRLQNISQRHLQMVGVETWESEAMLRKIPISNEFHINHTHVSADLTEGNVADSRIVVDSRTVAERMMDEGPEVSSGAVVMIEASEVTSVVVVMIEASEATSRVVVMAEGSQVTSEAMLMADGSEGTSKAMMMAQGPVISRANVEAGWMEAGPSELDSGELLMMTEGSETSGAMVIAGESELPSTAMELLNGSASYPPILKTKMIFLTHLRFLTSVQSRCKKDSFWNRSHRSKSRRQRRMRNWSIFRWFPWSRSWRWKSPHCGCSRRGHNRFSDFCYRPVLFLLLHLWAWSCMNQRSHGPPFSISSLIKNHEFDFLFEFHSPLDPKSYSAVEALVRGRSKSRSCGRESKALWESGQGLINGWASIVVTDFKLMTST